MAILADGFSTKDSKSSRQISFPVNALTLCITPEYVPKSRFLPCIEGEERILPWLVKAHIFLPEAASNAYMFLSALPT